MKPVKGLHIDTRPIEQPEGTYPFGKNGIQYDLLGSTYNEQGWNQLVGMQLPYKPNGVIETDKGPIIFTTNNVNSAIGLLDTVNNVYIPIVDDRTWNVTLPGSSVIAKLGFNINNFITGQSQRNYLGQLTIVFTDKTLFPMYLNCDAPSLITIDDMRLFANFATPDIAVTAGTGGNVAAGAYYVAIGYEKNDGTSTQYAQVSPVTIVPNGSVVGVAAGVLNISVTNVDTNYDAARVAIISVIGGVINAMELTDYQQITGPTLDFTFTGNELFATADVTDIITPPAIYDKVGTIGQLNDYLYIGNLEEQHDIDDMQPYAASVVIEWVSQIFNAVSPPANHVNGTIKGFAHEEVYAIYIRYNKTLGGTSKWYATVGPRPRPADLLPSAAAVTGGMTGTIPLTFQVDDCIPYYDTVGLTGGFGTWQNSTETYPNDPNYNLSSLGGPDLRGQPVTHHKTPSHRWCAENLYASNPAYGQTELDLLGIRALNVKIPDKYIGVINGYEIGFAIRTIGNMINYGQGAILHGVTDHHSDSVGNVIGTNTPVYTDGGNFCTNVVNHGDVDNTNDLGKIRTETFRTHPFDVLFNKPSIAPDFLSRQFRLYKGNLNTPTSYMEDGDLTGNNTGPLEYLIDYTNSGDNSINTGNPIAGKTPNIVGQFKLRHVNTSFYTPTGTNVGDFINTASEYAFCGYLDGTAWPYVATAYPGAQPSMQWDQALGNTHASEALKYEEIYIANLISIKQDLYQNFYSQQLTTTGKVLELTDDSPIFSGDVYINPYTWHVYGRINSLDQLVSGIKIARRIVCESVSNQNLRYVDPANQYTDYWPKSPLVQSDVTNYLTLFSRSQDPNQFGYTKDFNQLNSLIDSTIWNSFSVYTYSFPYRIHRGGKASRTGRPRSWRTFLADDFYEMIKNMGMIVKLEGMDDRLIIHMQKAMFLTQDKTQLESGPISVTLGAGDIFQFEPQEAISSKLGYAGTQHELACVRTPFGYVFVDASNGEIYLYKGKLSLLNQGINTFLRDFLTLPDVNNYAGNGITIGWDQRFKRIILTVKNRQLPNGTTIIPYSNTTSFWLQLVPGSIVSYQGRYIKYIGLNNTIYQCPAAPITQTITWQPINQFCLKDNSGNNTGVMGWALRARYINGVADGYTEPNTNSGAGTYFPPIINTGICALPAPITTWVGSNGVCLQTQTQTCPNGYTLDSVNNVCTQTLTEAATPPSGGGGTPGTATGVQSVAWNNGGARVIQNFNADGTPSNETTVVYLPKPHLWVNGNFQWDNAGRNLVDGRMNAAGIWVAGGTSGDPYTPVNEWIGFSRKFTVNTAQIYYIGMAADNSFQIFLNGVKVIDTTANNGNIDGAPNFAYWNIYPLQLVAGTNYIEMLAENYGDVAGFAAEIYGNTLATLQTANSSADLDILFSTSTVIGQQFNLGQTIGYSCNPGWSLDPTTNTCIQINRIAPTTGESGTNSGLMLSNTRCRQINGVLDGYCEPNTNGGGIGPYLPAVASSACTSTAPPAPGDVTIAGTILITCSDNNCNQNGRVSITMTFVNPTPGFNLLIGQIVNGFNSSQKYGVGFGSSAVFGDYPDGVIADPNYNFNGASTPFSVFIPQGTTNVTISAPIVQKGDNAIGGGMWICNNCTYPITDLYFKFDTSTQPTTDTNIYSVNISPSNPGITGHNE